MIGVDIKCPNSVKSLDLVAGMVGLMNEGLRCNICEDEVYLSTQKSGELDIITYQLNEEYTPKELLSVLLGGRINVMVFLEMFCFDKTDPWEEVNTYDDFVRSKCQVIILVVDCDYVEVYAKDQELLKKLTDFAVNLGLEVEEKTLENDGREKMHVW